MMLTYVPIIALKTYRMILKHYRPLETENLSKKYAEQWRTPLHTIKDVEQKVTFIPRP